MSFSSGHGDFRSIHPRHACTNHQFQWQRCVPVDQVVPPSIHAYALTHAPNTQHPTPNTTRHDGQFVASTPFFFFLPFVAFFFFCPALFWLMVELLTRRRLRYDMRATEHGHTWHGMSHDEDARAADCSRELAEFYHVFHSSRARTYVT